MNGELYDFEKVARLVEKYCQKHNILESDYADLIGVHAAHLPRIKKGEMCSPEALAKIAALGKIPVQRLYKQTPQRLKQELIEQGRRKELPVCM